ncbi:MAG: DUF177 domain-containing protein [Coriobacteriia bacterium]|nr:DUF177 domain-containing protein [Coriobacteriia bacterium]
MEPLRIDVTEIREELGAHISVQRSVDLGALAVAQIEFTPMGPGSVDISILNTGTGLVAQGRVNATVRTECARCLEPFDLDIEVAVETFYADREEAQLLDEDVDWEPIESGSIDLAPAIQAAVTVDLPFAPVCADDCRGICPTCGNNLNETACMCASSETSPPSPFSALKDLFPGGET